MNSSGEVPLPCNTYIGADNECVSLVNQREPEWMRHTTEPAVTDPTRALTLQLLQSLVERPGPYTEVLETRWTSRPQLSIWEDACIDRSVDCTPGSHLVAVSARDRAFLAMSTTD